MNSAACRWARSRCNSSSDWSVTWVSRPSGKPWPSTARVWSRAFCGGEPVDAGGQYPLHRGRQLGGESAARHGRHELHPPDGSRRSTPWSTSVDQFLHEEGILRRFRQDEGLQRRQGLAIPLAVPRAARTSPPIPTDRAAVGCNRFCSPAVVELGTICHQQEEAGGGHPVAEQVQPGLRLTV